LIHPFRSRRSRKPAVRVAVDPLAYSASTLTAIVKGHKQSRIDELMLWNYSGRTNG
jgi:hypothetical protein